MINRGGQKVSPLEVDTLINSWPEVKEAATFAKPHSSLGEEVAVAIVALHPIEEREIRKRCSEHLADYKCPKSYFFIDALPRNENGKLQRSLLADLSQRPAKLFTTETSPTERKLLKLASEILEEENLCKEDDFFDAGGDSLSAAALVAAIEKLWSISMADFIFFQHPRFSQIASYIDGLQNQENVLTAQEHAPSLSKRLDLKMRRMLQGWQGTPAFPGSYGISTGAQENLPTLFWCCNGYGEVETIKQATSQIYNVTAFRTLRKIQHKRLRDVDTLCRIYAAHIEKIQPTGKLHLGGFCEGGRVIAKVAKLLIERGREIAHFIFHDFELEESVSAHVSYIYTDSWHKNPLSRYVDVQKGWDILYKGKFGVYELYGRHGVSKSPLWLTEVKPFLEKEFRKVSTRLHVSEPAKNMAFHLELKITSHIPMVIKAGQPYQLEATVTNTSNQNVENLGYFVHARWIDLAGDLKFKQKMASPLPRILQPGETVPIKLTISNHKKNRLYRLDTAVVLEGYKWQQYSSKWILTL